MSGNGNGKGDLLPLLAKAFVEACAEMEMPKKSAQNSYYKNKYATLEDVLNIARPALAKHGLVVHQFVRRDPERCITRVLHVSGGSIQDEGVRIIHKEETPQAYGSALTYARRYGLQLFLGLTGEPDDDDAETVMGRGPAATPSKPMPSKSAAPKVLPKAQSPGPVKEPQGGWEVWYKDQKEGLLTKFKTVPELEMWLHQNRAALITLKADRNDLFVPLEEAFEQRITELANANTEGKTDA